MEAWPTFCFSVARSSFSGCPGGSRTCAIACSRAIEESEAAMIYALGGIVAVGLLVYLVIALLKPEVFS